MFGNLVMIQFKMGFKPHSCFHFVSFITHIQETISTVPNVSVLAHMLWLVNNVYMRQPETLLYCFLLHVQ